MVETVIKANSAEAQRLYQRGMAAARGGQRRVAVGLLTRSLQLDPSNEAAWLWLSGVMDDPHHVAFCLRSVLKLNPNNERARQGLQWLEERQLLNGPPKHAPVLDVQVEEPVAQRSARVQGESWWVNWRQARREISRVRLLLWSVPLVVLCLALVLHQTFALALEEQAPDLAPTTLAAADLAVPIPTATVVPILESEPAAVREGLTISYLSSFESLRQQLRSAVESYRTATGRSAGTSLSHVTAAQTLRASVSEAYSALQALTPPQDLQTAHADYLKGLELEMQALDDLMEFYSSYQVALANRAALRMQQANEYISQANSAIAARKDQMAQTSAISVHTVR